MKRKLIGTIGGFLLIYVWLSIPVAAGAECRLLMMIARNEAGKITSCDAYEEAFTLLSQQAQNQFMADGWAISYFEQGKTHTGEGKIWFDIDDPENYYLSNRFSSWVRVWNDSTNYYETIAHLRDNVDTKLIAAHVRQATFGALNVPNPHPFVMEINGYAYTFAHNGSASGGANLTAMRETIQGFVDLNGWDGVDWNVYIHNDVDSAVYFGFLMAHIKHNNWDILRGLRVALQSPLINNTGWSGKNFIFSDGFDAYAFRSVGNRYQGPSYRLEYRIVHENTDTESAIIMTRLPPGEDVVEIELDELVFIPQNGRPIHFKEFNQPSLKWQKKPYPPLLYNMRYWTWSSFPVLDPHLGGNNTNSVETLTQRYEPSGSYNGFGTTILVKDQTGSTLQRESHDRIWEFGENPLRILNHISGYKMLHNPHSDSTSALISGEICPADMAVTLQPGVDNWVGYWLLNNQTAKQSLGENLTNIKSIESIDWSYYTVRTKSSPDNSMEFGQMYKIRLFEDITYPIDFTWHNSRSPESGRRTRQTSYFIYDHQPQYQVIDIDYIEDDEEILEVGLFADSKCIGAVSMGDYPLQILTYPHGYEGSELQFRFYKGRNRVVDSAHKIAVYNEESGQYSEGNIFAGEHDYITVKLINIDDINDQPKPGYMRAYVSPNPFNPGTHIALQLAKPAEVKIVIYNVKGQNIRNLYDDQQVNNKGNYYWDGKNDTGEDAGSGVYFYKISSNHKVLTGKMLMMK